jgi:hypothetical protein
MIMLKKPKDSYKVIAIKLQLQLVRMINVGLLRQIQGMILC